ncbi:SHOCT domain-containing protein [Chryseobacterium aurantiacum]|uniref:SHOCT domain-containing protein n=1 Tax=Chryseobacterium aurantiacum TaxID=2116499 RepID=UPI000D11E004|nr:SHOCT domain-containing protein [Chryseobacterium aurantiacum]
MQNIRYQVQYINPNLLVWGVEYIDQLPDILMEGEKIIHIIDGLYNENATLLLSTGTRLIFKELGTDSVEVVPHERIVKIDYLQPLIKISTEDNTFQFETADLKLALGFCKKVNAALGYQEAEESEVPVLELLDQLGKLRENGVLTDEEFAEQKKRLLEKL